MKTQVDLREAQWKEALRRLIVASQTEKDGLTERYEREAQVLREAHS